MSWRLAARAATRSSSRSDSSAVRSALCCSSWVIRSWRAWMSVGAPRPDSRQARSPRARERASSSCRIRAVSRLLRSLAFARSACSDAVVTPCPSSACGCVSAGDAGDADGFACGEGFAQGGASPFAAAGCGFLAAVVQGGRHELSPDWKSGRGWRTWGMPRWIGRRPRPTSAMASSSWARSSGSRSSRSVLTRRMSLRTRVISSSDGMASAFAQSSASRAAARRSRFRRRSPRYASRSGR